VLDAILLEQEQVPAIAVITEPFRATGRAMAESWGAGGFPVVETPHPIAGLGQPELEQRAEILVERILEALTDPRRPVRGAE
jgi:hypothetical protein